MAMVLARSQTPSSKPNNKLPLATLLWVVEATAGKKEVMNRDATEGKLPTAEAGLQRAPRAEELKRKSPTKQTSSFRTQW